MGNNVVITIGREFGSGGREIGKKVADRLGIKFYDKELLQEAAKESGFCREIFENQDESARSCLSIMMRSQQTVFFILL